MVRLLLYSLLLFLLSTYPNIVVTYNEIYGKLLGFFFPSIKNWLHNRFLLDSYVRLSHTGLLRIEKKNFGHCLSFYWTITVYSWADGSLIVSEILHSVFVLLLKSRKISGKTPNFVLPRDQQYLGFCPRFYRTLTLIIFNVCPRFFQKSACHSCGNHTLYWHIKCPKLSSWKAEKSRTKTQNFTAWFVLPRDQQHLGFCPRFYIVSWCFS